MAEIIKGWFSEDCPLWPGKALSIEIEKILFSQKNEYQTIEVFQTKTCGVMLVLDGIIQCTEEDEFAYQEMMTHIPICAHPNPKRVLVVGGGDGGVAREITRHDCVESVDVCEIDGMVIDVAKQFLPGMAIGFDDPRVTLNICDGMKFVREHIACYDVIIVDSSDPVGPGEELFKKGFYEDLRQALRPDGLIATQAESLSLHPDITRKVLGFAKDLFPLWGYAFMMVPTYPGGNIGVCVASLKHDVKIPNRIPSEETLNQLRYYSPAIHQASFTLPAFCQRILDEI